MTILRLARIEGGRVVPWRADPGTDAAKAWALWEVSVRAARVDRAAPSEADGLVAALKVGWPKWEQERQVLVLRPGVDEAVWHATGLNKNGRPVPLAYDTRRGLIIG